MDPSKEPAADVRQLASAMFAHYNALVMEGFTETQACIILGTMLGTVGRK